MDITALEKQIEKSKKKLYSTGLYQDALNGKMTQGKYRGFLQETYHYVKNASRFYAAAASRLEEQYEDMRKELLLYAAEENGHEKYLLNDLEALGIDPRAVRDSDPLVATAALNGFHFYITTYGNPLSIWGNIYAIESFSDEAAGPAAKSIMHSLRLRDDAVTFLTTHSSSDPVHSRHSPGARMIIEKFINSPEDEKAVIFCARGALELHANMYQAIDNYY